MSNNSYEKRLRAFLREGDVIPFPTPREREQRKKGYVDVQTQMDNLKNDIESSFNAQTQAEEYIADLTNQVRRYGASQARKFVVPFVMKDYKPDVNPIWALVWTLREYLETGDANEALNIEQARFAYKFLDNNLEEMLAAINDDIESIEEIRNEAMNMEIPLPDYAADSAIRFLYNLKDLRTTLERFRMYDGIFQHPERVWSRRQARTRDRLLAENVVIGAEPFDKTTTGMPYYDDILRMPDYFEEEKGVVFLIMNMSPDEYIARAQKGFEQHHNYSGNILDTRTEKLAKEYARKMMAGEKFPMPVLSYTNLSFSQEGLHRAWAAKIAGYDKIPVLVVDNTEEKKNDIRQQSKQPSRGFW